jgi:hypothetical protein
MRSAAARRRFGDPERAADSGGPGTGTHGTDAATSRELDAVRRVARLVAQEPDSVTLLQSLAPLLAEVLDAQSIVLAALREEVIENVTPWGIPDDAFNTLGACYAMMEWVAQRRERFVTDDRRLAIPGVPVSLADIGWREVMVVLRCITPDMPRRCC